MEEILKYTKDLVKDWHIAFNVQPPQNEKEAKAFLPLRVELFSEELKEYQDEVKLNRNNNESLIEKADAIGDMLVVISGTIDLIERSPEEVQVVLLQMMGQIINDSVNQIRAYLNITKNRLIKENIKEIVTEIMSSNMSKLDDKGRSIINGVSIFDGSNETIYDIEHIEGEIILTKDKPVGKVIKSNNFIEPDIRKILYKN